MLIQSKTPATVILTPYNLPINCPPILKLFYSVTYYCCNHYDYNKYEITATTDMLIQMMTIIMIVILVLIIEMRMAIKKYIHVEGDTNQSSVIIMLCNENDNDRDDNVDSINNDDSQG